MLNNNDTELLAKLIANASTLSECGKHDLLLIAQGIKLGENLRIGKESNATLAESR